MIDEHTHELALSQLAQAREEKMLLFEKVKRLTEEVAMSRSSSDNQADRQSETIKDLSNMISDLSAQVEKLFINRDKCDFLPCHYHICELPRINSLEVAKPLSMAA